MASLSKPLAIGDCSQSSAFLRSREQGRWKVLGLRSHGWPPWQPARSRSYRGPPESHLASKLRCGGKGSVRKKRLPPVTGNSPGVRGSVPGTRAEGQRCISDGFTASPGTRTQGRCLVRPCAPCAGSEELLACPAPAPPGPGTDTRACTALCP